jgi:hypothetical protein
MSIQLSYSFSFKKNQNQYNGTDYIYKKLKTGKEMGGGGGGECKRRLNKYFAMKKAK